MNFGVMKKIMKSKFLIFSLLHLACQYLILLKSIFYANFIKFKFDQMVKFIHHICAYASNRCKVKVIFW
ncbi:hypothetical protein A9Z64_10420 [Moraxella osloensis]|nr:hypothetical protein AXE82_11215 [Moraxella osloensis]OBX54357.1 hypothetical protein A9Z64_10420 [Moraxella osloensis]